MFIIWISSVRKTCPLPHLSIYLSMHLYQYGLQDIYFILWLIIQYYHYLFVGCLAIQVDSCV